jgi:hypothetical protein
MLDVLVGFFGLGRVVNTWTEVTCNQFDAMYIGLEKALLLNNEVYWGVNDVICEI